MSRVTIQHIVYPVLNDVNLFYNESRKNYVLFTRVIILFIYY